MTIEPFFNVASVKLCTRALGPGPRMAIWFQGCNMGCEGCYNPELQPIVERHLVPLSELVKAAERSVQDVSIEGVTFIGGEPTLQRGLPALASALKDLGLGIILFTGLKYENLSTDLTSCVDLVIDGRYESNNPDSERNIIGSRNQRMIHVTDRYSHDSWFYESRPDFIEVDIDGDLSITNGNAY